MNSKPSITHQQDILPLPDFQSMLKNIPRTTYKKLSVELVQLSEEHRVMLSADEIFALYLREVAHKTNSFFYQQMLRYILLYRDCLNEYGWQKLAESHCREAKQSLEERNINARMSEAHFREMMNAYEFCAIQNAEVAPEICNDFVTVYLDARRDSGLEKMDAIDYTRNFCHWLFISGHTCSKLSLIS